MCSKGIIISFEGIGGAGKTTLIERIYKALDREGYEIYMKPDLYSYHDKSIGGDIKKILSRFDKQFFKIGHPIVEALLIAAKRAYDAKTYLKPALDAGKIILADRDLDTYCAYQAASIKTLYQQIELSEIIDWLIRLDGFGGLTPDITIYLHLNVEKALERSIKREGYKTDNEAKEYTSLIVNIYEYLIQNDKDGRIIKIDVSNKSIDEIYNYCFNIILEKLRGGKT